MSLESDEFSLALTRAVISLDRVRELSKKLPRNPKLTEQLSELPAYTSYTAYFLLNLRNEINDKD